MNETSLQWFYLEITNAHNEHKWLHKKRERIVGRGPAIKKRGGPALRWRFVESEEKGWFYLENRDRRDVKLFLCLKKEKDGYKVCMMNIERKAHPHKYGLLWRRATVEGDTFCLENKLVKKKYLVVIPGPKPDSGAKVGIGAFRKVADQKKSSPLQQLEQAMAKAFQPAVFKAHPHSLDYTLAALQEMEIGPKSVDEANKKVSSSIPQTAEKLSSVFAKTGDALEKLQKLSQNGNKALKIFQEAGQVIKVLKTLSSSLTAFSAV